jgi:uncharacterized protein YlzI (FlbEa/FlbD family)
VSMPDLTIRLIVGMRSIIESSIDFGFGIGRGLD